MKKQSIIIAGPTASGKSDFAHQLAQRINGSIINCDSVQIYKGIETISASPFAGNKDGCFDEIDGVPYYLFSILELSEQLSVSDYLTLAKNTYDKVIDTGKTPIFVGGTGYYINVLINGISSIPEVSDSNRYKARAMVKDSPDKARELLPKDFIFVDPQRMARALEVFFETGKHLIEWQKIPKQGALIPDAYKILINPTKEVLLPRISERVPLMFGGNAIKEAQYIIDNHLDENRAIGATQLCKMLRGELSKEEAINNWVLKTNQYAKRQRTWYRHQFNADVEIAHLPTNTDIDNLLNYL